MRKSKQIKPVVDIAHISERDAAKSLGEALNDLRSAEQQLKQLIEYREEYTQRMQQSGVLGISRQGFEEYHTFISRITESIKSQEAVIIRAKQQLKEEKEFWYSKRGSSKVLDKVLDEYAKEESRKREKLE